MGLSPSDIGRVSHVSCRVMKISAELEAARAGMVIVYLSTLCVMEVRGPFTYPGNDHTNAWNVLRIYAD